MSRATPVEYDYPAGFLRGNVPDIIMMPCGVHKRPKKISVQPRRLGERPRTGAQRYRRQVEGGDKLGSCECDFHDFPELRAEREKAAMITQFSRTFFPFRRLPGELRNNIHGLVLTFRDAIEFCPEPFTFSGQGQLKGDFLVNYKQSAKYHHQSTKHKLNTAAALMRTDRQNSKETTSIFYGTNEFRFSNTTGWISLDFFLNKIGLEKAAMLRMVTVCHPKFLVKPVSVSSQESFKKGCIYLEIGGIIKEPGFVYEKRWFEEQGTTRDPALVLEKVGELQKLCLTVPVYADPGAANDTVVDENKFEDLKISFLGLHSKSVPAKWINEPGWWVRDNIRKGRASAQSAGVQNGKQYKVEDIFLDEVGFYRSLAMARPEKN